MGNFRLADMVGTLALILLVLLMQPMLVDSASSSTCSMKGYLNETDGACNCISPHYGRDCALKHCPSGTSWNTQPVDAHTKLQPFTECSDMGYCNTDTGVCKCRSGFEGRACERVSCGGAGVFLGSAVVQPCSGHGRCRSLREMGAGFDGLSLIRPPVVYDQWDADKFETCLCDEGYGSYDCSKRMCPTGKDPQDTASASITPEVVLECAATGGYFAMHIRGQWTQPIPYDADATYLKRVIGKLAGVGEVAVTTSVDSAASKLCSSAVGTPLETSIFLSNHAGDHPPMTVSTTPGATRQMPSGDTELVLSGQAAPVLGFVTRHTLTCPTCAACTSSLQLALGTSYSTSILPMTQNAAALVTAIAAMPALLATGWTDLAVTATTAGGGNVCSASADQVTTIDLRSAFGNLPPLALTDSSMLDANQDVVVALTLSSTTGAGKTYPCSRQGICNELSGICQCFQSFDTTTNTFTYRTASSDGVGSAGGQGECGFVSTALAEAKCTAMATTAVATDATSTVELKCSGHGECKSGGGCTCFGEWYGITCGLRDCPSGRAWADEPVSATEAHQLTECSNMGHCSRDTGVCDCRVGWTGAACQHLDCPYSDLGNDKGDHCSGHGWCMNLNLAAAHDGVTYGDYSSPSDHPEAWDAFSAHKCMCSAEMLAGFDGRKDYPSHSGSGIVSGVVTEAAPLPGYKGYDCGRRNCPAGDVTSERYGRGGKTEMQRVICPFESDASQPDFFTLSLYGQESAPIGKAYTALQIRAAVEEMSVLKNVSITFPSSHLDHIGRACANFVSYGDGGFVVEFITSHGDLPMLIASHFDVEVVEYRKGSGNSEECSGAQMGQCDYSTGKCACYAGFGSSNGSYATPGDRGDCSHHIGVDHEMIVHN